MYVQMSRVDGAIVIVLFETLISATLLEMIWYYLYMALFKLFDRRTVGVYRKWCCEFIHGSQNEL